MGVSIKIKLKKKKEQEMMDIRLVVTSSEEAEMRLKGHTLNVNYW